MNVKRLVSGMTVKQKIGQMMVCGFETARPDDPHFEKLVSQYHVGNVILFTRNLGNREETVRLTQAVREKIMADCGVPPFVVIDQEGGMVTRIFSAGNIVPGPMAIGATYNSQNAYEIARIIAQEMRALGMNFDYAPCVEEALFRTPSNVSVRCFSDNPYMVAEYCKQFVRGLQDNGVIATLKHFPGYTGVMEDAHLEIPTSIRTRNELDKIEFTAWRDVIADGADCVMAGHLNSPALDPDCGLTSASHKVITELLKGEMGFEGLVSSDCMDMRSLLDAYGAGAGAVAMIKAGTHLLCISHTIESQAAACDALYEAVMSGEIPEAQLDEIVEHILKFKIKYNLFEEKPAQERLASVNWEENRRICERVSRESVTVVRGKEMLPLQTGNGMFISTKPLSLVIVDEKIAADDMLADAAAVRFGGVAREIALNPDDGQIAQLAQEARGKDYVLLATYNAFCNPQQQKLQAALLAANPNVISVATRASYDYDCAGDVPCFILLYEYTRLSIRSLLGALAGEYEPEGLPPVAL
ncbi:MAG: glycoside hydrolase family 3 protein [Clostridia bacterium]|nr:glycoside hydrolase family 3 protein [Clostridia bacterium]